MVSTPEGFTNNSPRSHMNPTPAKKTSSRKSLCLFIHILYVKKKNDINRVGADKSERKVIQAGTMPWALKSK